MRSPAHNLFLEIGLREGLLALEQIRDFEKADPDGRLDPAEHFVEGGQLQPDEVRKIRDLAWREQVGGPSIMMPKSGDATGESLLGIGGAAPKGSSSDAGADPGEQDDGPEGDLPSMPEADPSVTDSLLGMSSVPAPQEAPGEKKPDEAVPAAPSTPAGGESPSGAGPARDRTGGKGETPSDEGDPSMPLAGIGGGESLLGLGELNAPVDEKPEPRKTESADAPESVLEKPPRAGSGSSLLEGGAMAQENEAPPKKEKGDTDSWMFEEDEILATLPDEKEEDGKEPDTVDKTVLMGPKAGAQDPSLLGAGSIQKTVPPTKRRERPRDADIVDESGRGAMPKDPSYVAEEVGQTPPPQGGDPGRVAEEIAARGHTPPTHPPGGPRRSQETPREFRTPEGQRVVLGRYMIEKELGRGGMGIVYLARDMTLNRVVAIKLLKGDDFSPDEINRFVREGRLAGSLAHPNIVTVYDTETDGKNHYIVMEFVEGRTVDEWIAEQSTAMPPGERDRLAQLTGRLSATPPTMAVEETASGTVIPSTLSGARKDDATRELLNFICQASDALAFAHSRGIIHRDIKPQNIMITEGGVAKVMDFGLAKDVSGASVHTASGTILGTPQYMSPEQARGEVRGLDERSDTYSLAAVTYFCFCGIPPFEGPTIFDTLQQVVDNDPIPPRRIKPKLHRDLEIILLKGLAKERERRYTNPKEFAEDIRAFLEGRPISARPPSLWYKTIRKIRRSRKLQISIAALIVLAAATVGFIYLGREREQLLDWQAKIENQRQLIQHPLKMAGELKGSEKLKKLDEAVELGSDLALPLLERCEYLVSQAKYREALADAEKARKNAEKLPGDNAQIQAQVYYWLGRVKGAIVPLEEVSGASGPDFKTAERLGGDHWAASLAASLRLSFSGKTEEAVAKASEVIRQYYTKSEAYIIRGVCRIDSRDFAGAADDFDSAVRYNEQSVEARLNRGKLRLATGDLQGALEDCNSAIRLNRQSASAYYLRGEIYKEKGVDPLWFSDWLHALDKDPDFPQKGLILATVPSDAEKLEDSVAMLASVRERLRSILRARDTLRRLERMPSGVFGLFPGPILRAVLKKTLTEAPATFTKAAWEDLQLALEMSSKKDPLVHWFAYYFRLHEARKQTEVGRRKDLLREAFKHRKEALISSESAGTPFDPSGDEALLRSLSVTWEETLTRGPKLK